MARSAKTGTCKHCEGSIIRMDGLWWHEHQVVGRRWWRITCNVDYEVSPIYRSAEPMDVTQRE